jgi:hypothetical protein
MFPGLLGWSTHVRNTYPDTITAAVHPNEFIPLVIQINLRLEQDLQPASASAVRIFENSGPEFSGKQRPRA